MATFRNKLKREPSKKFVILSDWTTRGVSCIPIAWLNYSSGQFKYPLSTKNLKKLVKMGEIYQEDWPWYNIECIFNETDDYNKSKDMVNESCGYISNVEEPDEIIECTGVRVLNTEYNEHVSEVIPEQQENSTLQSEPNKSNKRKKKSTNEENGVNESVPVVEEADISKPKRERRIPFPSKPPEGHQEFGHCKCSEDIATIKSTVLSIQNFLEKNFVPRTNSIYRKSPRKLTSEARIQSTLNLPIECEGDFDKIEKKVEDRNSNYVKSLFGFWSQLTKPLESGKMKNIYLALFTSVFAKDSRAPLYQEFTISGQKEKRSMKTTILFARMKDFLATKFPGKYDESDFENTGRYFVKGKTDYARTVTNRSTVLQTPVASNPMFQNDSQKDYGDTNRFLIFSDEQPNPISINEEHLAPMLNLANNIEIPSFPSDVEPNGETFIPLH